jgi:hypothetical protein
MSYERSLVVRAQPHIIAAQAHGLYEREASKGCSSDLAPFFVALEPPYTPLIDPQEVLQAPSREVYVRATPPTPERLRRLRLWTPANQECDWLRSELFCKQLNSLQFPCAFEIVGNQQRILVSFLCDKDDEPVIRAALRGAFPRCELSAMPGRAEDYPPFPHTDGILLHDYWPSPPYSELLTRSGELHLSPFETLLSVLGEIHPPMIGIYQVLFQPTQRSHDWSRNVKLLIDIDFAMRLFHNPHVQYQYAQQTPSGQLGAMTSEILTKSHNDKPLFFVLVRLCLAGGVEPEAQHTFRALSTFMGLYQHGGRPLESVTEAVYLETIGPERTRDLFRLGITCRSGFLLNSAELTSLVHAPPMASFCERGLPLDILNGTALPSGALNKGILIGHQHHGDSVEPVCIPEDIDIRLVHVIGESGFGKSTIFETLILAHAERGDGCCVIDPHGDLFQRLLDIIPEHCADRVVVFTLTDPDYVPAWNIMRQDLGERLGLPAGAFIEAFKKSTPTGWGDRLAHLLHHAIYGLLHLPEATLLDVADLLSPGFKGLEQLCSRVLEVVENPVSRRFFEQDIKHYAKTDLWPPQHKLSKILLTDEIHLALCQPDNRFSLRDIMDQGKIFLVDLSGLETYIRNLLGCLFLSFFHHAALSRSRIPPDNRRRFYLFIDEAHRFTTETLEDLITECRKYALGLRMAHHFMRQFPQAQEDALKQVGTTIAFNLPEDEARVMARCLGNKIEPDELTTLGIGEAVVRIGPYVTRIKTPAPTPVPNSSPRNRILQLSREKYYRPRKEVSEYLRLHYGHWSQLRKRAISASWDHADPHEVFEYDEL